MKTHFIGIGGIGVSALAQYYLAKGHEVSGSDLQSSEITDFLKDKGMKIATGGHFADNVKSDFNLVVYSPAVPKDNPEILQAQKFGIKTASYPEALGELTRQHFTIAISGSHGKSTTTAMVGLALIEAGMDPTVIVGTRLKEFGNSNFRMGHSSFLVIEACEYDDSFIHYSPKIIVVTNVDKEHLDYFKTFANVKKAFKDFISRLPKDGFLVANRDDKNMPKIVKPIFGIKYYYLKQKESAKIKKILQIPGQHNVSNALAVLEVCKILNVPEKTILKSLSKYKGSWRRFEIFKRKNYTVISDYGHHPNEVAATLKAAREKYPTQKIWCIFQPHQYQRTYYLFNDFVKIFREVKIDEIIITDIYDVAGREEKQISQKISSESLVKKINKKYIRYLTILNAEKFVKENIKSGEILIIMGAGNIYKLVEKF